MSKSEKIEAFWSEFCKAGEVDSQTAYQSWSFGNTPEMAEELLHLVLAGRKTATAGLVWEYEYESESLETLDTFIVITDADENPKAILQPTEVRIVPFNEVDAEFAFDEGEGDRSLDFWRRVHWDYFSKVCTVIGRTPEQTMPIQCLRFKLVYSIKNDENPKSKI